MVYDHHEILPVSCSHEIAQKFGEHFGQTRLPSTVQWVDSIRQININGKFSGRNHILLIHHFILSHFDFDLLAIVFTMRKFVDGCCCCCYEDLSYGVINGFLMDRTMFTSYLSIVWNHLWFAIIFLTVHGGISVFVFTVQFTCNKVCWIVGIPGKNTPLLSINHCLLVVNAFSYRQVCTKFCIKIQFLWHQWTFCKHFEFTILLLCFSFEC